MPGKPVRKLVAAALCAAAFVAVTLSRDTGPSAADPPATPPGAGPAFVLEPYLQFATRTSIVVMCETDRPTSCVVEYGPTFPPERTVEVQTPGTLHEVTLDGLQPNAKYFYRVVCSADGKKLEGKYLTFSTAVGPADAFSFTVIGDTQKNPAVTGKIAKLMWDRRPHFVLHMGDVVDNGPDKREWVHELFWPCRDLFARVPVYPCIGNHEKNHEHYYRYFSLPKPEYHYSYRYGNAEFFVLDTNKSPKPGDGQYEWLDKVLGASDARWKFCYHHHPCYTSDSDDYGDTYKGHSKLGDAKARPLIALYEKHKVDVAMNGHIHLYERTWPVREGRVDPKGVVYLTTGGGGGKLEDFDPVPAFFRNQGRVDYHFCQFTVHGGTLECKAFDQEGRLFDSFSLRKD
ncbi:MAG TPA: metallophosphoesterase family protein [Fimbriiglobus sp.]|nr:metallophosphoesterase family protein [Fimbriiglobus sp.]